jgi:hypothetical protein
MPELSAYVARATHTADPVFLMISPSGEQDWVPDTARATPFPSVREATRHALRMPARFRAFGLLRPCESAAA